MSTAASSAAKGRGPGIWLILLGLLAFGSMSIAWAGTKTFAVQTTASGLKYQVLREGKGARPAADAQVAVHYEGRLQDGTIFDSSYTRGEPAVFGLGQVIPGWSEGVQLMTPGAKYRFTIPPQLAYGPEGVPGVIPPNATLVFDVELLGVAGQ